MADPLVRRVLGTTIGVSTDVYGVDRSKDKDKDGYVEKHEVNAEQWKDVMDSGEKALKRRLSTYNAFPHNVGKIYSVATRYGVPAVAAAARDFSYVPHFAFAFSAVSEVIGGVVRKEDFLDPAIMLNKAATVTYEGLSSLLAAKAGILVGGASSFVVTPVGGVAVGIGTAIAAKAGIDLVKDRVVYAMAEWLDQ